MWNTEDFGTDKALHFSMVDALEQDIRSGKLKTGDRLPTNRELAQKMGVNLTTITKAYAEAANRGLISAVVGKGTFVAANGCGRSSMLEALLDDKSLELSMGVPLTHCDQELLPVVEKVLRANDFRRYMRYSDLRGQPEHRGIGAEWIKRYGVDASPDSVVVTAGAQHAILCVFYALFRQGDRLATSALISPGVKAVAGRMGMRLEGVPMDEEGIIPDQLEALCKRQAIKGLYAAGRIQYPTNRKMSQRRREQLARVVLKHNLLLVENDLYAFLCERSNQTLSALVPKNSVYISSVSKAFYAGLRIAFICAPPKFSEHLTQGILDTVILASPLNAAIVCECLRSGLADSIIQCKRREMQERRAIFQKVFDKHEFSCPVESMAVWLHLPHRWSGANFEKHAYKNGLRVFGAERFAVGSIVPPNCIRVALSGPENSLVFEKALGVLKRAVEYID